MGEATMIRLIAGSTFALLAATSVQAMTPAAIARPDGMVTQVAFGCGVGQTLLNGQCVARTYIRQARREAYGVAAPVADTSRLYVTPYGGVGQGYYTVPHYSIYNQYIADATGLPWYAVRAYYAGGPWYIGTNGWDDYAARNGIGCTPGSLIKGGDGIMYVCQ
jgi:hypothetical protein